MCYSGAFILHLISCNYTSRNGKIKEVKKWDKIPVFIIEIVVGMRKVDNKHQNWKDRRDATTEGDIEAHGRIIWSKRHHP